MSTGRSRRPAWLGKPTVVAPLAVVPVLVVVAVAALGRDDGDRSSRSSAEPSSTTAGPGQRTGHRPAASAGTGGGAALVLGEAGRSGGLVVVVEDAVIEPDPGGREELVVSVTLRNDGDQVQDYGLPAFTLEAEGGRIEFPVPSPREDALIRGTLEPGASVSGVVVFRAGGGSYVLAVAPDDPEERERARWAFTV